MRLVIWLCLTLCDPMDGTPPGSSVREILQARTLKWVAILFSRDLPDPGIEPRSPALQAGSLLPEPPGKPEVTHGGGLVAGSGPTLCNPMDCSPPASSNHGKFIHGFSRQEYRSGLPFPSPFIL